MAPRPKNPSTTYNYNLANSFPATYSSNFYPTTTTNNSTIINSNYPNFPINSINYTNYPVNPAAASTVSSVAATTATSGNLSSSVANATSAFNPFLAKTLNGGSKNKSERKLNVVEKKFNSLKSIGVKKSPQFYSMRVNKCKRHASGGSDHLIMQQQQSSSAAHSMPYITQKLKTLEQQPLYENLTDSIQIHESTLHDETTFESGLDEFNNMEVNNDERHSIYRSDSGISNSSYECITPVPAPRTNPRKCQSAPVYMNLPNKGHGSRGSQKNGIKIGNYQGHHQVKHNSKCKSSSGSGSGGGGGSGGGSSTGGAFHNYEVC